MFSFTLVNSIKQAVRRNIERVPEEFMFEKSLNEYSSLRSQIVIANRESIKYAPFTAAEQRVIMRFLFCVWKSDKGEH